MHNEEKRNHPPRNHGPMKSVEKPKNFDFWIIVKFSLSDCIVFIVLTKKL